MIVTPEKLLPGDTLYCCLDTSGYDIEGKKYELVYPRFVSKHALYIDNVAYRARTHLLMIVQCTRN